MNWFLAHGKAVNWLISMSSSQEGQQPSIIAQLLPFILLIVVFYIFIILPQSRKAKQHQKMLAELQKGDRILTTGGLIGTIVGIDEKKIVLKIAENVKVEIANGYVVEKLGTE